MLKTEAGKRLEISRGDLHPLLLIHKTEGKKNHCSNLTILLFAALSLMARSHAGNSNGAAKTEGGEKYNPSKTAVKF